MELYLINMSNHGLKLEDIDKFLHLVSPEKKKRILRFHFFEDSLRSLLGDLLARYSIISSTQINNSEIQFTFNEYGKPSVVGFEEINFNISHSNNYILCGIDTKKIGVDVELIKKTNVNIAKRFFSTYEYKSILSLAPNKQLQKFFDIWTLKESYIKADGRGMSIPLESFSIKFLAKGIKVHTNNAILDYHLTQYNIDPLYKMAVCSENMNFPKDITIIKSTDLLNKMLHL